MDQPKLHPALGDERLPLGARITGGVLVLNALFVVAELFLPGPRGVGGPVPAIIDLVVGGSLLLGLERWRQIAVVRICLGALLLTGLNLVKAEYLSAGLQLVFSASLLLLLLGKPGALRITGALVLASGILVLEGIGVYASAGGANPLLALRSDLEHDALKTLDGAAFAYRLQTHGPRWYLRTPAAAHKDNPLSDRWLTQPELDAHVMIIAEKLEPGTEIDMDKLVTVVGDNAKATSTAYRLISQAPLKSAIAGARVVRTEATINGMEMSFEYGLFSAKGAVFQVVCFAPRAVFGGVEPHFRAMIASFELR